MYNFSFHTYVIPMFEIDSSEFYFSDPDLFPDTKLISLIHFAYITGIHLSHT